jgi:hypothetical protein
MSIDVHTSFEREILTRSGGTYMKGFNTKQLNVLIKERKVVQK